MNIRHAAAALFIGLVCLASSSTSAQDALRRGTYAHFETSLGNFTAVLEAQLAPRTVDNFIGLARGTRPWRDPRTGEMVTGKPFYDGLSFHRVVRDFVIQTGDPGGTGTGGPGYTIPDEFSMQLRHDSSGILSMANRGQRNSGGSQFFITLQQAPDLNGVNTVFGRVIRGMDVVRKIGAVRIRNEKPETPVILNRVRIEVVE
jgi:peptidyl-prolyl cis-trans isomerase A (cyclophilin A)